MEQCICDAYRPVQTDTRLALIWHRDEQRKSTNTGRIAVNTLRNSQTFIRGEKDRPLDLSPLEDPSRRLMVLFPTSGARVLTPEVVAESTKPVTLVVPDATWGQARKTVRREPILADVEKFIPPPGPPTRYFLRHAHDTSKLGTAEAIARAFGVLEGMEVQREIERMFELMVQRTLLMRNPKPTRRS